MRLLRWMGGFVRSLGLDTLGSIVAEGVRQRHGLPPLLMVATEVAGSLYPLSFPVFPWHLGNPW